jgi:hypothetical protein
VSRRDGGSGDPTDWDRLPDRVEKAYFLLQHRDVWSFDWPAPYEDIRVFICNPSFGEVEIRRIREHLPDAVCLAYTNAQEAFLGMYDGAYWRAFDAAFDSSHCIRNLETGEIVRFGAAEGEPGYGLAEFVMREESAEALAAFHRDVTLAVSWDGLYVDQAHRHYPSWKKVRLLREAPSFDIDGDGTADRLWQIDASYEAWKPHFLRRLRKVLGRRRILIANSGGELVDPSLNGITLEGIGVRHEVEDAGSWFRAQRAVAVPPFLGVVWSDLRVEELAAARLSSEIRGVMPGVFRVGGLHDVSWGGGP